MPKKEWVFEAQNRKIARSRIGLLPAAFDWRAYADDISEFDLKTRAAAIEHYLITQPPESQVNKKLAPLFIAHNVAYKKPVCEDTAVICSYFNYANSVKLLENFYAFRARLRAAGIPNYAAEVALTGQEKQTDAELFLHSPSALFYKEELWARLVRDLPAQYTKILFVDADIIFSASDWLDQCSKLLDINDVIQPMDLCVFLNRAALISTAASFKRNTRAEKLTTSQAHPGFALGVRRDWFQKVGFPRTLMGSGDSVFWHCAIQAQQKKFWFGTAGQKFYAAEIKKYVAAIAKNMPRIGCLFGVSAIHLPHGCYQKRRYVARYELFDAKKFAALTVADAGLPYLPAESEYAQIALKYFQSRQEDGEPQTAERMAAAWRHFDPQNAVVAILEMHNEPPATNLTAALTDIKIKPQRVLQPSDKIGDYRRLFEQLLRQHPACHLFLLVSGDAALLCANRDDFWRRVIYGLHENPKNSVLFCHNLSLADFCIRDMSLFHCALAEKSPGVCAKHSGHSCVAVSRAGLESAVAALRQLSASDLNASSTLISAVCHSPVDLCAAGLINNLTQSTPADKF